MSRARSQRTLGTGAILGLISGDSAPAELRLGQTRSSTKHYCMTNIPCSDHRHVFVCGLHRSGTTLYTRLLHQHPDISGFRNTGAQEDEGQHLQTVFPAARAFGGPGRFGLNKQSWIDETSPLLTEENRVKLASEWNVHWDLSKPILAEKSPPNIVRSRYLQAIFPGSVFILVTRDPIAVSYATKRKWCKKSIGYLLRHWLVCHEKFRSDSKHLNHSFVVTYEDLVASPQIVMNQTFDALGIPKFDVHADTDRSVNSRYWKGWQELGSRSPWGKVYRATLMAAYETRFRKFGYSLSIPLRPAT